MLRLFKGTCEAVRAMHDYRAPLASRVNPHPSRENQSSAATASSSSAARQKRNVQVDNGHSDEEDEDDDDKPLAAKMSPSTQVKKARARRALFQGQCRRVF